MINDWIDRLWENPLKRLVSLVVAGLCGFPIGAYMATFVWTHPQTNPYAKAITVLGFMLAGVCWFALASRFLRVPPTDTQTLPSTASSAEPLLSREADPQYGLRVQGEARRALRHATGR